MEQRKKPTGATTMQDCVDRSEVSRSLAKAIAYQNCGKTEEAEAWARKLVEQLKLAQILSGP